MKNQRGETNPVLLVIGVILLAAVGVWLLPRMNWGKFQWTPAEVVTVSGEARTQQANQIASFTAGVDSVKDKKEDAVKEVNTKVEELTKAVKDFGIEAGDIKTNNISIYQTEEMYWEGGVQKSRKGQWRVSNSVEVTLRDLSKSSALTDLLSSSGANNVWGPNFRFDDTSAIEKTLFDQAMNDAKVKAEIISKSSGRQLGKVISVTEGNGGGNIFPMYSMKEGAGGGGAPVEPGMGTVSKTITVTYELK